MSCHAEPTALSGPAAAPARAHSNAIGKERLLQVEGLNIYARTQAGLVKLVDEVSFDIRAGEILGLVGESGSGKTMIGMALMRLLPRGVHADGQVLLDGQDLLTLPEPKLRKVRGGRIGIVFQESVAALNPAFTVGSQIAAAIRAHADCSATVARARATELLDQVRIPDPGSRLDLYPHQLSGGMCQRVMIAMALSGGARLLVADEPTTSLDVTIQGQIVLLLEQLVREIGISILFISHDLGLVSRLCDRLAVAYAGELVETGETRAILSGAQHPYTRALIECVPSMKQAGVLLKGIPGYPPLPGSWPGGCRYLERCRFSGEQCTQRQQARTIGSDRVARCWRAEPGGKAANA